MKQVFRHRLWVTALLLAGIVAVYCGCAAAGRPQAAPPPVRFTILFFNDIHGHLLPFSIGAESNKRDVGGIARLSTQIDEIRAENQGQGRRTFLFIAGDILQGTPLSTVYHGQPDIECFNAMGVDALTVGNHEFDFGLDNFARLRQMADFPFLSANIRVKATGDRLCRPAATFELAEGLELTVVGLTTRELLSTTRADYVRDLEVEDPLESVRQFVRDGARKGPVVLLSHSRHAADRQIAASLPEIAAVIGGHDHLLFAPYRLVNGVPIFEALDNGRYLGRIDLASDPVSGDTVLESSRYLPVTAETAENATISAIVAGYQGQLGDRFKAVIGTSEILLDGRRPHVRYEETTLGDFVTDVMQAYTGAEIALVNGGALRASIEPGPVTLESVFRALPFENQIMRVQLTGSEIAAALQRSVRGSREDEDGGFLQVSGIRFSISGHQVSDLRVGDPPRALDPKAIYTVAMPDFLATGGDGYDLFVGKPSLNTRLSLRDTVVDAIRSRAAVTRPRGDRIVREKN